MSTDFEYRLEDGLAVVWILRVTGYDDELDGEDLAESSYQLSDIELTIESFTAEYVADTGAALTRVYGSHGRRTLEWSNGAVHQYEWRHEILDLRCHHCKSPDNDLYMVTDQVWESSGLDGWACFRCLEAAIGRQLVPSDFKTDIPANTNVVQHCTELQGRIGLI